MFAAALLGLVFDPLVGEQIALEPGAAVLIGGQTVKEQMGGVWRIVGREGDRYRVVADGPARVGFINAREQWETRLVRVGEGWWSRYVGRTFWSYRPTYYVGYRENVWGSAMVDLGRDQIRVEAAIPLKGRHYVYLDDGSMDNFFHTESADRVIFVVSFVSDRLGGFSVGDDDPEPFPGPGESAHPGNLEMPELNKVGGRIWTSVLVAGEWDAQRHFSEKSLDAELGYSRREFERRFARGVKKGMSRREVAWLFGWPQMQASPEEAMKRDLWSYNNIPFEATYRFRNGRLVSWQVPNLP